MAQRNVPQNATAWTPDEDLMNEMGDLFNNGPLIQRTQASLRSLLAESERLRTLHTHGGEGNGHTFYAPLTKGYSIKKLRKFMENENKENLPPRRS